MALEVYGFLSQFKKAVFKNNKIIMYLELISVLHLKKYLKSHSFILDLFDWSQKEKREISNYK